MRRYEEITVETQPGIKITLEETSDSKLIIRASNVKMQECSDIIKEQCEVEQIPEELLNYKNPPIPNGYMHILGNWDDGFVIERIKDGSQFVWVPVGYLDEDGLQDGINTRTKFGRRNYKKDTFLFNGFNEELTPELESQFNSVEKYGGFYVSRYNIVEDNNSFKSIRNCRPFLTKSYQDAEKIASEVETSSSVKSHLLYGCEYDSILAWFIKSGARTYKEVVQNSSQCGNYWNTGNSIQQHSVTGMFDEWATNQIFDLFGNFEEWTQEKFGIRYKNSEYTIRGGNYNWLGYVYPVACRRKVSSNSKREFSFRIALWLE